MNFVKMRFVLLLLVLGMTPVVYGTNKAPEVGVGDGVVRTEDQILNAELDQRNAELEASAEFEHLAQLDQGVQDEFYKFAAQFKSLQDSVNRKGKLNDQDKQKLASVYKRFRINHSKLFKLLQDARFVHFCGKIKDKDNKFAQALKLDEADIDNIKKNDLSKLSFEKRLGLCDVFTRWRSDVGADKDNSSSGCDSLFGYGRNSTPDTIISEKLMKWQMDPSRDGTVASYLAEDKWGVRDLFGVMGACATYAFLNACLTAPIDIMKNVIQKGLGALISYIGLGLNKGTSVFFHNNAIPVTGDALNRWHKCLFSIISGVKDEASQERVSGDVGKGLLRLNQYQDSEEPVDGAKKEPVKVEAANNYWQEISKIYLMQILQMVREIEARAKYYNQSDEIVICLRGLITVLIGEAPVIAPVDSKDAPKKTDAAPAILNPIGGVYAHFARARTLADLAAPDVACALSLLLQNFKSFTTQLANLIQTKDREQEEARNLLGSGSSKHSSKFDFGGLTDD